MSVCDITFLFQIQQDVTIVALGLVGCVTELSWNGRMRQYRVTWWSDGKRNDEWLYDHELAAVGE